MDKMKENIFNMIESGKIILADYNTQDIFPDLSEQGLILNDGELAARIGGNWFYYGEKGNIEDFCYAEHAKMIADVINNPEENGLGDGEAEFYRAFVAWKPIL